MSSMYSKFELRRDRSIWAILRMNEDLIIKTLSQGLFDYLVRISLFI